jgi:hypothetical protein
VPDQLISQKVGDLHDSSAALAVFGGFSMKPISLEQDEFLNGAGGGIRTHERLRDRVLSPAPLTWLGDPRLQSR